MAREKYALHQERIKTLDGLKDGDALLVARGFKARFFHATLFELTAIILTALYLMLVMGSNFFDMGVLAIAISLTATAWNGVFNFIFDRLQKRVTSFSARMACNNV